MLLSAAGYRDDRFAARKARVNGVLRVRENCDFLKGGCPLNLVLFVGSVARVNSDVLTVNRLFIATEITINQ